MKMPIIEWIGDGRPQPYRVIIERESGTVYEWAFKTFRDAQKYRDDQLNNQWREVSGPMERGEK